MAFAGEGGMVMILRGEMCLFRPGSLGVLGRMGGLPVFRSNVIASMYIILQRYIPQYLKFFSPINNAVAVVHMTSELRYGL